MKWILLLLKIGGDVQQKGWYASKTVWFNVLTLLAGMAALKGFNLNAEDISYLAVTIPAVVNIGLRMVTRAPLGARTVPTVSPGVDGIAGGTVNAGGPVAGAVADADPATPVPSPGTAKTGSVEPLFRAEGEDIFWGR